MTNNLPSFPDAVPETVIAAAKAVSENPAFLERMRIDWPYLGIAAEADRLFGQAATKDSAGYRHAREGLQNFLDWAGNDGRFVRGLAPYAATDATVTADTDQQIALDFEAVARMADVLHKCSQDSRQKKGKKRFLPLLAELAVEWHAALNLPTPALSDTSPAVILMCAIASAHKIEIGADAHRKALASAISD